MISALPQFRRINIRSIRRRLADAGMLTEVPPERIDVFATAQMFESKIDGYLANPVSFETADLTPEFVVP
ncbi:hypothetical protein A2Z33_02225 [Candidatus Gottesmanbacteria bacterium RBG_16_52_11]|uniref:Uncharacterized protein n=1 Tax=Candidatus Gottesmanbacteria bacterium RBG_16_52_11 TaxID=1798374 RepID=A0A1F5YRS6_9BACT|nr:MAG: hypothetical protein A2Z33_02225 [Candidatus Gottesmanbacteria bacterium RBG_16_52_11]